MPDDFTANPRTAGTVAVGGAATGTIDTERDVDWFAVELTVGRTYVIDVEGDDGGGGTLDDAMLRGLYDGEGRRIAGTRDRDGGEGDDARLIFTAFESGTHYIAARSQEGTGTYTVRVATHVDADAAPGGVVDLDDIAALRGGRAHRDSLDGEVDWVDRYHFTLSEAKQVKLGLGQLDRDADLYLEDENGQVLYWSTQDGTAKEGIAQTLMAGTYHVRVKARDWGQNDYVLRYRVAEPEMTSVAVGDSARGRIGPGGDRDWFAVTLEAGEVYRIDMKGRGALSGPYLYGVHDGDGNDIPDTSNDSGSLGGLSRAWIAPAESGTYYVEAGATVGLTGPYTLSVTEVADDFTADETGAGTVAVGGAATGEVDHPGDRDWFAVTLEKDTLYRIDLKGGYRIDATGGTLWNPTLHGIHDADGNLIAGTGNEDRYRGGGDFDSLVFFTPAEDGTYHVAAGGHWRRTGTYTLSVEEVVDDFAADKTGAGTVAVGGAATGAIDYSGDRDWFAVTLEKDTTYRIDQTGDATWVPDLHGIHDADGNLVAGTENDDGDFDSRWLEFTAAESGTYYVAAGGRGDLTGTYALSVVADDFTAGKTAAGAVKVGGSATGAIDIADDVDWFAVALEAGRTYRFELRGSGTGEGTLPSPRLKGVYDADGDFTPTPGYAYAPGRVSWTSFTAPEDGTYYVAAAGFPYPTRDFKSAYAVGTYTLTAEEVVDAM